MIETQDVAKADDRVTIDFVGSVDGEEFEGGKSTDFVLAMGQGRMISVLKRVSLVIKRVNNLKLM